MVVPSVSFRPPSPFFPLNWALLAASTAIWLLIFVAVTKYLKSPPGVQKFNGQEERAKEKSRHTLVIKSCLLLIPNCIISTGLIIAYLKQHRLKDARSNLFLLLLTINGFKISELILHYKLYKHLKKSELNTTWIQLALFTFVMFSTVKIHHIVRIIWAVLFSSFFRDLSKVLEYYGYELSSKLTQLSYAIAYMKTRTLSFYGVIFTMIHEKEWNIVVCLLCNLIWIFSMSFSWELILQSLSILKELTQGNHLFVTLSRFMGLMKRFKMLFILSTCTYSLHMLIIARGKHAEKEWTSLEMLEAQRATMEGALRFDSVGFGSQ